MWKNTQIGVSKKHKYFNQNKFHKIKTTLIPFKYAVPTHTIKSRIKFIDLIGNT